MLLDVKRFRKKPITIEAVKFTGNNHDQVRLFTGPTKTYIHPNLVQLEVWNDQEDQWITVPPGHWVAKGLLGEFYPISQAAIDQTYDEVTDG